MNLVTNPGFEDTSVNQLAPGWWLEPAVNGSHFVRRTEANPGIAHGGLNYVMFGALHQQPDVITQTLPTTPGRRYDVGFWIWNTTAGQDSMRVTWDDTVILDQTPTVSVYGWTRFGATLTATGSTSLLSVAGYDGIEFTRLDDVTVFELAQACYPNCDGSTTAPVLNVNDFICFQTRFAAGESYANCDGSTQAPVLNVNDFVCFQLRFASGCP